MITRLFAAAFLFSLFYALLWPTGLEPVAWTPAAAPELSGILSENSHLAKVERLPTGDAGAPEGIARDTQGGVYAACEHGDILHFGHPQSPAATIAKVDGRPLGIAVSTRGELFVALPGSGLLRIPAGRREGVLLSEVDGIPLGFVNGVAVAASGHVYFTDSSSRHGPADLHRELFEQRASGRLIRYDPISGRAETLLNDLYFPNGVTLGPGEAFALVAETFRYRILRVWLKGPRKGETTSFASNLPGFPDGISRGEHGIYWLALYAPRSPLLDVVMPYPFLRQILSRLPQAIIPDPEAYGMVLGLDEAGKVVRNLQDPRGAFAPITDVAEYEGYLYLGSFDEPAVGRVELPVH
ncbi:MAG: SMP-30/gluconolactonase/LRE family protein [Gammaproteobacteria bacterium]|nr:SMP-30/gluconolactonase/LRE family protein [Gammaproteobacteria bacterium]